MQATSWYILVMFSARYETRVNSSRLKVFRLNSISDFLRMNFLQSGVCSCVDL